MVALEQIRVTSGGTLGRLPITIASLALLIGSAVISALVLGGLLSLLLGGLSVWAWGAILAIAIGAAFVFFRVLATIGDEEDS